MRTRTLFAATAAIALLASCNQGPPTPEKTVQQLMADDVQPTAEVFWDSVQYISDETGQHEILPETDEDWQRTRTAAATITEMGNLMMTPLYAEGRGEDWMEFSRGLVEVGQKAEQAAVNRDVDAVFEVGGTMYSVCSACHQAYLPEEQAAEANAPQ